MFSVRTLHRHAKRLYKMLQESKVKEKEKGIAESYEKYAEIEPVEGDGKEDVPILGHCYERKTRFRLPIVPLKLTKHGDGKTVNIYNKMQYWDLEVSNTGLRGRRVKDIVIWT